GHICFLGDVLHEFQRQAHIVVEVSSEFAAPHEVEDVQATATVHQMIADAARYTSVEQPLSIDAGVPHRNIGLAREGIALESIDSVTHLKRSGEALTVAVAE